MNTPQHLAKHCQELHFGGDWTGSNLKTALTGVTWQQATEKVHNLNTIAVLTFHINYYLSATLKALEGEPLHAHDKYSFDCPPIKSGTDWQRLTDRVWDEAERFSEKMAEIPEGDLDKVFQQEKYGVLHRNLQGITEHGYYHLGQIVLIKKLLTK